MRWGKAQGITTLAVAVPGFVFAELILVVFLLGILVSLIGPVSAKWIRRSEDIAACSTLRQIFGLARLEAVKRTVNVVVVVDLAPDGRVRLRAFQDRANDAAVPLPADEAAAAGNGVQDQGTFAGSPATDEPTLAEVSLSHAICFWKEGIGKGDIAEAIRFDTYGGNAALTDRVIFLPSGGIAPPEDAGSSPSTASGGRGIYFADWQGRNFFRITVTSDLSGKGRLDKYVDGRGYVADGWTWK